MKKLFLLFVTILGFCSWGWGQALLLEENFSYTVGTNLSANGWTAHSGAGTNAVKITAASINYTNYPSSGIGDEITLVASGEDDNRSFTQQTSGTLYASVLVNVLNANNGDYFFHFGSSSLTSDLKGRVFVKKDASNNVYFGISKAGTAANAGWSTTAYALNTTYLLVLKYTIVSGVTNDITALYINPVIGETEPLTPSATPLDPTGTDIANLGSIAIRQGTAGNLVNVKLDGIRVGMTWNDVLPVNYSAPTTQASSVIFSSVTASTFTAGWTIGDGSNRIAKINTTNSFTDPADGDNPTANAVYGGSGEQVVYNGSGSSVDVSGLATASTYWIKVWEYNGSGTNTKFCTATGTNNPMSQTTLSSATAPIITSPTATGITYNEAVLGGTITADGGSAITERGTVWSNTSGVTIADHKEAEGGTAMGAFSHTRIMLPSETQIYYKAYAINGIGTTLTDEANFYTLALEPTTHVSGLTGVSNSQSTVDLSWTTAATGAEGYIILQRTGGAVPTGMPADATGYTVGTPIGNGIVAAFLTSGSALDATITGLTTLTQYTFIVIPFAWDGANNATINYYTQIIIPSATVTTQSPAPTTFTWTGAAGTTAWTDALNWSGGTTIPTQYDIVILDNSIVAGSYSVDLPSGAVKTTILRLAITPSTGNTITLTLPISNTYGASGDAGLVVGDNTSLTDDIIINEGGILINASGAPSGNGVQVHSTVNGTCRINNGGKYVHKCSRSAAGIIPLLSTAAGTETGIFEYDAPGTASFSISASARTFGSLYLTRSSGSGAYTSSGADVTVRGDFKIGSGVTYSTTMTGTMSIGGNLINNGTTLSITTQFVYLNGTSPQNIQGTAAIVFNGFGYDNILGISLQRDLTVNGFFAIGNGQFFTGDYNLNMGVNASFAIGTPSEANMVVATGTGKLIKYFPIGFTGTFDFPVGDTTDADEYSPVSLNFTSGTFDAVSYVSVNLANSKYPDDPNTDSYLNRYWNISSSGITAFSCDAILQYLPADVHGTESDIYCIRMLPTPETQFDAANTSLHQLSATGLSEFGSFTGTQMPTTKTLSLYAFLEGLYNGAGAMNQAQSETGNQFAGNTADQIAIELHDATNYSSIEYTALGVNINTDGNSTLIIPSDKNGTYYITLKHRNSVATVSAVPVSFAGGIINYDFTSAATQAFGSNMKQAADGAWTFYGGDVNQDDFVDSGDMTPVDNDAANFTMGYVNSDVNGDGFVDSADMTIIDNNAAAFISVVTP
ncbi:MAG: hypothetical protein M0R21_10590 [Lentimicrobiaceae bacterium]|nr:hypothetical protein [Lentimicrobiaceae bacterium]